MNEMLVVSVSVEVMECKELYIMKFLKLTKE
jgi:hypothetical protein